MALHRQVTNIIIEPVELWANGTQKESYQARKTVWGQRACHGSMRT